MIEAGLVIGANGEILHEHTPLGRTGTWMPDSPDLWDVLWAAHQANNLLGFAHSHPGSGIPDPSHTDITTFTAVEAGLGRPLHWWIISSDHVVLLNRDDGARNKFAYRQYPTTIIDLVYLSHLVDCPTWFGRLRELSETKE